MMHKKEIFVMSRMIEKLKCIKTCRLKSGNVSEKKHKEKKIIKLNTGNGQMKVGMT